MAIPYNLLRRQKLLGYVIGINWELNSSACLFKDGELLGAVSEERFTRRKNDEAYPKHSIDHLMKEYGVNDSHIDEVCFISEAWSPGYILTRHYTDFTIKDLVKEQHKLWKPRLFDNDSKTSILDIFEDKIDLDQYPGAGFWAPILDHYKGKIAHAHDKDEIGYGKKIREAVAKHHLNIEKDRIFFVDHSMGHSCYAYYTSPKATATPKLVITLDAFGDFVNYTARIFDYEGGKICVTELAKGNNAIIARLYRLATLVLGMKSNEHEYKVMGLAPYAKFKYYSELLNVFKSWQKVESSDFIDLSDRPKDLYFSLQDTIEGYRFDAVAGALQAFAEHLLIDWVTNLINTTNLKDIVFAGGVAMNVKANQLLTKIDQINSFHVPVTPDDSSQCIGACFAYYHLYHPGILDTNTNTNNAYLGPGPGETQDEQNLMTYLKSQNYKIIDTGIEKYAAKILAEGKILARIVGRQEFGARALGNRSLLCDPSNITSKEKLNLQVKSRDFWMPFPVCSIQYCTEYLKLDQASEFYKYMTICADATDKGKSALVMAFIKLTQHVDLR